MSNLVIGYDSALLRAEDSVFLFLTYQNDFHSFQKIFLGYCAAPVFNCKDCSLIDHICKIGTYCSGSCKCDVLEIYGLIQMYISGMYFQDLDSSFQIRTVNDHSSVKTSRSQKCRVKNLRTVGRCQDQKSLGSVKTIHLGKKLIQSLLTLIIAAAIMRITALTDCIDLIDKDDTRCVLLRFFKQVTDTGSTHADKHLHKLRT